MPEINNKDLSQVRRHIDFNPDENEAMSDLPIGCVQNRKNSGVGTYFKYVSTL